MSFLTRNGLQYWSDSPGSSEDVAVDRDRSIRRELVGKSYERPAKAKSALPWSWSAWKHLRSLHVLHVVRTPGDLASIVSGRAAAACTAAALATTT